MKPAAPVTSTFLFAMHHSPKLLRRLKVNFSVDISLSRILTRNSAARIAQDNGMAGDIAVHICPRGDEDAIADVNAPDDGGVYARPTRSLPILARLFSYHGSLARSSRPCAGCSSLR